MGIWVLAIISLSQGMSVDEGLEHLSVNAGKDSWNEERVIGCVKYEYFIIWSVFQVVPHSE